jgi:hypothetical protein
MQHVQECQMHYYDTMLTQYNLRQGLEAFKEDGVKAVEKELKSLHTMDACKPLNPELVTKEQKSAALRYLMYLTKKRCGRIKARGCADGRKQRSYMTKEETSSPTVATESLMLSCAIDARENRDVATVDIPVAFMQADMEGIVDMKLEGPMADMFAKLDPKLYSEHVRTEHGKSVLYVRLKKALYGTLQASLLFWKRLTVLLM